MRWRIYYGDGTTYSSEDGPPEKAPATNVMVVAAEMPNEKGFGLVYGTSYLHGYWYFRDGGWQTCDQPGFWDELLLQPNPHILLFGRTIRDADFWAIIERAGREGLG